MNDQGNKRTDVFTTHSHKSCLEAKLVLESAGIVPQMHRPDRHPNHEIWALSVPTEDSSAAIAELVEYRAEESSAADPRSVLTPVFGGTAAGVIGYLIVLVSVAIMSKLSVYGWSWDLIGQMRAGDVMAGQWWRTVTALTLHVDLAHLLSNVVFGSVFGVMVGRLLGGGVGWLAIVLAGAIGNGFNGFFRDPDHTSIGASTAVFAALGILVSHALLPRSDNQQRPMVRWAPLVAGVLLLVMMGTEGERTDVFAHVAGFGAGLIVGLAVCRLPTDWLKNDVLQSIAGITVVAVIILCWTAASWTASP